MTGSLSICVFYVSLVLPSDHTRSSSALFYVKVSSPRALGLQCILNPGHGGAHSRSSLCKDKGACKPLPSLAPFPLSGWAVIDVPNARRDAYVLSSLD